MHVIENEDIIYKKVDDILFIEFKRPIHLTVEKVKEMIELRHQISNNEKQYCCYNTRGLLSIDRAASDYSSKFGQDYMHASAVIVNSHLTKFIVNMLLLTKKSKILNKVFSDEKSALIWLKEKKLNNELLNKNYN